MAQVIACEETSRKSIVDKQLQWQIQGLDRYQYILQRQCFCSHEYTQEMQIVVENNQVIEVIYADSGESVNDKVFSQQLTISQWYDLMLKSMSNDIKVSKILSSLK